MPSEPTPDTPSAPAQPRGGAWRIVAAVAILGAAAGAFAWWSGRSAPPPAKPPESIPSLVFLERDGLRYEYDALRGTERLYDLAEPPPRHEDLTASRPDDAARLRNAILADLHLDSLDALREMYAQEAEQLRRMGYLK